MALRIDRASFLTLTFGMSGLACNSGPSPVVAANVVDIPQQPAQVGDGGSAPVALGRGEEPKPDSPRAVPPPTEEDVPEDSVPLTVLTPLASSPAGCGWVDPKTVTRPSVACNDDQGMAPTCNVMKSCSGFPFPRQKCEAYRRFLKPQVAQKALVCLAKLNDKQVCDACNAYRCGDQAIKTACPDSSVDATCTQIIAKCSSVSMTDCRSYLWGLNAAGRAKMMSCLGAKSGCGFGIYSCSESLY